MIREHRARSFACSLRVGFFGVANFTVEAFFFTFFTASAAAPAGFALGFAAAFLLLAATLGGWLLLFPLFPDIEARSQAKWST